MGVCSCKLHLDHRWYGLQVKETTRDVKFLHNEMFFAAAQRKYVYVYDKRGIEIHCMKVGPLSEFEILKIPK